jgi:Ca2+-binding RTX toxin-like protein
MSHSFTNPGTTELAFPTGGGNTVLIPVQEDPLSMSAAAGIAAKLHSELAAGTITPYTFDGTSDFNPPTGNTELILDTGASLDLPANITEVLVNTNQSVTLSEDAAGAQQDVVAGTGGLTYLTNSSSGAILAAGGDNLIEVLAGGTHTISTGAGDDVIEAVQGNNTIAAGVGTNVMSLGDGNNYVLSTGNDFVLASGEVGGTDTINAASNTNSDQIFGGFNNLVFINGTAASSLEGDSGSDTVYGGAGGGVYSGGSNGNNLLIGGTGAVTLVGGGSGDVLTLTTGHAANLLTAGAGNETLIGGLSTGANTFQAGSGNDLLVGGLGNDTLQAGTGNASMAGSLGHNQFLFVDGEAGGTDMLEDFQLSSGNKVALQGYGPNEVQNALADKVVAHGSTTITLSDNTSITFVGDTHVTASNFA